MRRTASEIIRNLEMRIARLERKANFKELEKQYLKLIPIGGTYLDLEEHLKNKNTKGWFLNNMKDFEPFIQEELFKCKQELAAIQESDFEAMIMAQRGASVLEGMKKN